MMATQVFDCADVVTKFGAQAPAFKLGVSAVLFVPLLCADDCNALFELSVVGCRGWVAT
jgi:hypothetical protein